ncbi:Uma2 family endonuclease [Pirellulaceae bacterium SH449]
MSTIAKLSGNDFDRMVMRGAFVDLEPIKVELIHGELRFMNPAGPVHEGEIQFLMEWSIRHANPNDIMIRVQSSINCGDHRPEPDLVWSRRMPTKRIRPTHSDVLLLIEVSDSSTVQDLGEKAKLYAEHDIPEYWVVDIQAEQVHVHRNPNQGQYQSVQPFTKDACVTPLCQPNADLSLAELFDLDS